MNVWHLFFQIKLYFSDFFHANKQISPIRWLYLITSALLFQKVHQYWIYNGGIILFYLRHIARCCSRSISSKTLSLRLLKCSPNSTNKSSNCSSVILYFLDQTMKFKNFIASELDEPRISDSSFPCLETSGPAHLMLTQFL